MNKLEELREKALPILAEKWNKKYGTQPYETNHLHHNYEDLVLDAMCEFAEQMIKDCMAEREQTLKSTALHYKVALETILKTLNNKALTREWCKLEIQQMINGLKFNTITDKQGLE